MRGLFPKMNIQIRSKSPSLLLKNLVMRNNAIWKTIEPFDRVQPSRIRFTPPKPQRRCQGDHRVERQRDKTGNNGSNGEVEITVDFEEDSADEEVIIVEDEEELEKAAEHLEQVAEKLEATQDQLEAAAEELVEAKEEELERLEEDEEDEEDDDLDAMDWKD